MAPEVFKDPSLPRTVKYDVYAFGILLWELLSGQKPFDAGKFYVFTQDRSQDSNSGGENLGRGQARTEGPKPDA